MRVDLIHDTYQFSPRSRIDGIKARQDKGDREGIPHTHLIPQVIRLELFLRP